MEFAKDQTVAVLTEKKEFVCLGKALVPSGSFKPGDTGLVIAPTSVFMQPGTYPRAWTKSDKIYPSKAEKKAKRKAAKPKSPRPAGRTERPAGKKSFGKPARRPDDRGRKKRYH